MEIDSLRRELAATLQKAHLSQFSFAARHGLSYSSLNKFLKAKDPNPRLSSIRAIREAINKEIGRL